MSARPPARFTWAQAVCLAGLSLGLDAGLVLWQAGEGRGCRAPAWLDPAEARTWCAALEAHAQLRAGGATTSVVGVSQGEPAGPFTPALRSTLEDLAGATALEPGTVASPPAMFLALADRGPLPPPEWVAARLVERLPPGQWDPGADPLADLLALGLWDLHLQAALHDAPGHPAGADPIPGTAGTMVVQMDAIMRRQVVEAAQARGLDPEPLLPDPAVRAAAIATGRMESLESQRLIAAYGEALRTLGVDTLPSFPQSDVGGVF